jgi:integrase
VGHISVIRRKGEIHGYSVYLGLDGAGKRRRKFFTKREDAEKHVHVDGLQPVSVEELWERKTELVYNLERLRPFGISLTDVVSFYLNHQSSKVGLMPLSQLFEEFLNEKRQSGRSLLYERTMKQVLGRFMDYTDGARCIGEITRENVADYVYVKNRHVSTTTKRNLLRNLSVLFNFAVKRDYLKLNPVAKIDRPTLLFKKPHVLTPVDFNKLLQTCLKLHWDDRLVVFVLVGFCGIRVEEASRLHWSNLHLDKCIVEVPATVAKKASFRNNVIPPNAMEWLRYVQDKRRKGLIVGQHWRSNLRSAVSFSKIDYHQNSIRHSFCSYALAAGWPLAEVSSYMGHGGGSAMIHTHYRNVVTPEDGKAWFNLVP